MAADPIEQHYYTRGREGLFQGGEGFDTVAKSPGLDPSFIRKTLHPYCLYIAPQELIRRGELDPSRYPESLTVFPADTGELVIGRAVFCGSDFTGQREAVFIHQFVVPRSRADEFRREPAALTRVTAFRSRHEEGEGKELPALAELPHLAASTADERDELLARLGVGEPVFKSLLAAVFTAVASKKKVYVALDADITDTPALAARLVEILYGCLPMEVRARFGFTTYNNEPQGKKNIDLMFVEKGSLRPGDRTGRDYAFDFPNERFPAPEPGAKDAFLSLAWEWRNRPDELGDFFDFAEEALEGLPAAERGSLAAYQELAALYRTGRGEYGRYEMEKGDLLAAALRYLRVGGYDRKPRLNELILALLRAEKAADAAGEAASPLPGPALSAFVDYYELAPAESRDELAEAVIGFMDRLAAGNEPDNQLLSDAQAALARQPELTRIVFGRIGMDIRYASLQEALLAERMNKVKSVKELQEEIVFWAGHSFDSLGLPYFVDAFRVKLRKALLKSGDQTVAGESLFRFCSQLYRAHPGNRGFGTFCDSLETETARVVLDSLTLDTCTYAELIKASYILTEDRLFTGVGLTEEQTGKLRILRGVYEAMVNQGPAAALSSGKSQLADIGDRLDAKVPVPSGLLAKERMGASPDRKETARERRFPAEDYTDAELSRIQGLVRRFLKGRIHPPQYGTLLFAFTEWSFRTGGEDRPVSYYDLLKFIHQETEDSEDVDSFLLWSSTQPAFLETGGKLLRPAYRNALRKYFVEVDRKGLADRKRFRKLTDESLPRPFRKALADIREDGGSPAMRFLRRNRRSLSLLVLLAVLISAGVMLLGRGGGKGEVSPSPVSSPPLTASPASSPGASGSPSGSLAPSGSGSSATPADSPSGTPSPSGSASSSPSPSKSPSP
ncbi:hypothetical protein [Gorillibacterium sp. sgz500922]|uniref:GAP1-N2 domain-containing protein n=1 Tax=Gorillibacterium sp. sgz500922 TaxID=3446694 RepID=UPI003F66EC3C